MSNLAKLDTHRWIRVDNPLTQLVGACTVCGLQLIAKDFAAMSGPYGVEASYLSIPKCNPVLRLKEQNHE